METKQAPIKCSKCGSTKIEEVITHTTIYNNYLFNHETGFYELDNEDWDGGDCSIQCGECGNEFSKDEYDVWLLQTRINMENQQTW